MWTLLNDNVKSGFQLKKTYIKIENAAIDPGASRMISGRSTIWANSPGGGGFWRYWRNVRISIW